MGMLYCTIGYGQRTSRAWQTGSVRHVYLLSDSKDSVSQFDLASGAATAPPSTADSSTRSQWLTRDAAAHLAIRNHLPLAECAHFGQHRTAQALYNDVVARYSSPTTAALGRLLLPYLFPKLSAFTTVEDLVSHLRASHARYRTAVPAQLLDRNPASMYITLYFIITCLPDSLCSVRDHFLSLDPTSLTVDLLEEHLAAETSAVAVGAARATLRQPFFEGCSPSPLAPSYASAAAADVSVPEDVGIASASAKRRSSMGKGGRGGGGGSGGGGGGNGSGGGGSSGGGGGGGLLAGVGALVAVVEAAVGVAAVEAVGLVAVGLALGVSVLGVASVSSSSVGARPHLPSSFVSGFCVGRLGVLARIAGGDCYRCVPPDLGIVAVALGASESGTLPSTARAEALHTFTLDSGASRCFFRDTTTPSPLPAPVLVLVSTAALQDAMVTTTTPGGQRVSICTCTWMGRHLATFTCRPGSSSRLLLVSPPDAPNSSVAPPPGPPLPASPSWHALSSSCLWSPQVSASPAALACPALPPLGRGAAPRRSSLLVVSPDDCSAVDSPHGLRLQLRERFSQDLPVLRLHSDRGGEFSSNLLREFCPKEGILQSFTLPDSPQENGIAERRIGLVMEVARTSMIHAAALHFLWPFVVRYAAHQLNLWPRVSMPETSPTLLWTGEVGDASVFRDRGSRTFVRDTSADKLSPCAIPYVFLGFVRGSFTTPPRAVSSILRTSRLTNPLPPQGLAPSGVSQVDPLPSPAPVQVAVDSGAARGTASGGAEPRGAEFEGVEIGGAEHGGIATGVEPRGAASEGAESGGAEPEGATSFGGSAGASPRLSPQQLCAGAVGAGGTGVTAGASVTGGIGVAAGASVTGGTATTSPGGACIRGTRAAGTGGVEGVGAGDLTGSGTTGAGGVGAGGAGVGGRGRGGVGVGGLGVGGAGARGAGAVDSVEAAVTAGLSTAPSPYTEHSGGLTERRETASCPIARVRTARRVPRSRPPPVPGTHAMTLRPSSVPLRVPLPAPPEYSLPEVTDPESDRARATSPTVSRLLATAVTDPSFESAAASALVAELLDFAASCRLD
ncbi:unnamed protein product [Closterium sp. NIES-54]